MEAKDSKVQPAPETFKVLITGCKDKSVWYNNEIGNIFDVTQDEYSESQSYHVIETEYYIQKSDCHVIEPVWKVMKDADEQKRTVEIWYGRGWSTKEKTCGWYPNNIYRLAPEPKQPEYEPYSYEDREKLRGLWVRRKDNNEEEIMITAIGLYRIGTSERLCPSYSELFEKYETLDGQPVGKLKTK